MSINALEHSGAARLLSFLDILQFCNGILTQFFTSNQVHDKMGFYAEAVRCLPLCDATHANESQDLL